MLKLFGLVMDGFRSLPVFNIEYEEEDEQDGNQVEVQEVKVPQKADHLHKLLSDRSLSSPRNSHYSISKKLEVIAEDNLLKKDLKETVRCFSLSGHVHHKKINFKLCFMILCLNF